MTKYIEQFWRGAKPEDVLRNPPMVARFRGTDGGDWMVAALFGYRHGDYCWLADELLGIWAQDCEVYDEPDWHKSKPEPGEGYRLLEKFPEPELIIAGDEFRFGNNWYEAGTGEQEATAWYRRKIEPAADEPVKFVAHPIQLNDKSEWLFQGKPIEYRSYAVLNEQGHYLQWRAGMTLEYLPGFRQAFTPPQLLQVSVRELGRNIRLRAVEPVDVDKLKQDVRQKLQPKAVEPKQQATELTTEGYYELPGSAFVEAGDRYFDDDDKTCEAYTSVGMLVSNTSRRYFRPILSFNEKRGWEFKGQKLDHIAYAVVNPSGKFLQSDSEHGTGFTDRLRQTWTPSGLAKVHLPLLANCKLVPVQPVFADPVIEKVDLSQPTYEPGKVYEHNGRKFRLADKPDEEKAVFASNIGLPDALQGAAQRLRYVFARGFQRYEVERRGNEFEYAFIEVHETPQPQEPKYVPFEWQDRHLLKNRYIRRDEDPDRERLILEIVRWMDGTVEVKCRDKSICVSELLRDYVFDDGTPCGKRVEQ